MSEEIICKKCGSVSDYRTEKSGPHLKAVCSCGAFIKFLPQEQPKLYFGKYNGEAIEDIKDEGYLTWLSENVKLSRRFSAAVVNQIEMLRGEIITA